MSNHKDPIWKVGESLEKIEAYNRGELSLNIDSLKPRTYYVVEVSLFKGNGKHRTIMVTGFNSDSEVVLMTDGYEEHFLKIRLENLHFINVISEIPEMKK